MRAFGAWCLMAVAGCLVTAGAIQSPPNASIPNPYVDSSVCAGCHKQIYDNFRKTGMGRSLYQPATSNTIEDYKDKNEYYSRLTDTHYAMVIRDGMYYQRRWQTGPDGTEVNVEESKVDYVVGSGEQARSYLHRTARNTLIELPLGWYSDLGGFWAMSPGFDSKHPPTKRMISYECMFCHNGYPQWSTESAQRTLDPVFAGKLPEGIDCQRCHGPGAEHVRVSQSPDPTLEKFKRTIVNPVNLAPERQLEVCMQCHLEPTSAHLPSIIRKFDREPFSYIPGQPLEEFTRYFDYPAGRGYDDRFQIVSAAYRLRKSRCFLESKGRLTCLNCHDPHQVLPTGQEAVQLYAKACRKCHEAGLAKETAAGKHTASIDCVSCHMPKRRTEDVVHAVITDHLIQRELPHRNLLAELPEVHTAESQEYRGEVVPYYPSHPLPSIENNLYKSTAQVLMKNNLSKGLSDMSRQMAENPPLRPEFYKTLGDAWSSDGKLRNAEDAYKQALKLDGNSLITLSDLARVQWQQGEATEAKATLGQALRLAPLEPNLLYQNALFTAQSGKLEEALTELQEALDINPDLPEGYFNQGNLFVRAGRLQEAEAALAKALRVDPYDAAAYDLLGQVMALKHNMPAARYQFQKAISLRPRFPAYLYNFALALVQAGQYDEAKVHVQAAIQADPKYGEAREVLGALYVRDNRPDLAISEYSKAVASQPGMMRAQLNLGLLLCSQGYRSKGVDHLKIAVTDHNPALAQQAREALSRCTVH